MILEIKQVERPWYQWRIFKDVWSSDLFKATGKLQAIDDAERFLQIIGRDPADIDVVTIEDDTHGKREFAWAVPGSLEEFEHQFERLLPGLTREDVR